jgi:hypothetical protein
MRSLALLLLLFAVPAWAQIEIDNPWSRATPPGAKVAAGYMVITNKSSSPDRLISVSSPAAARVETHVHIKDGNVMRMRQVKGYDIPANGRFELKPAGAHLMFIEPRQPFKEGDKIPAVLVFERAGEVKTEFQVVRLGATGAGHAH